MCTWQLEHELSKQFAKCKHYNYYIQCNILYHPSWPKQLDQTQPDPWINPAIAKSGIKLDTSNEWLCYADSVVNILITLTIIITSVILCRDYQLTSVYLLRRT